MIHEIPLPGLLKELQEWSEDHSKKLFREKIIRVYMKCLKTNRIKLAVRIAEKYRKELTSTLRSDLSMADNYTLFINNLFKK